MSLSNHQRLLVFILSVAGLAAWGLRAQAAAAKPFPAFEILTHRMDVDVDGAPTAYGPPNKRTLDYLHNGRLHGQAGAEIVGYLTDDDHPHVPVVQGPHDPAPGYYISQTAYTDRARTNERDPLRYIDATRINYVVLGNEARHKGARLSDFVAVHSRRTGRSVFGIVGDDGNPSGNEGSLHLLQALGYPFHDGKRDSVERREIVVRFFPHSNPQHRFFRTQNALDEAAMQKGLNRDFSSLGASKH